MESGSEEGVWVASFTRSVPALTLGFTWLFILVPLMPLVKRVSCALTVYTVTIQAVLPANTH